jgi:dihydroneopterin aldolase
MSRDVIRIEGLDVECIVGVREPERREPQPLRIDLALHLDASRAAHSGRIGATCDYDVVSQEVALLLRFRRYRLLEMAAEELAATLVGVHAQLTGVTVRLEKPRALAGRARAASVEIRRGAADFPRRREQAEFGEVEILYESCEAGLYLLQIDPRATIPPHYHRRMRELEWRVGGALERDGRRLVGLDPIEWQAEQVHTYVNVGDERATLFCCNHPPFTPAEEVVVRSEEPQ